MSFLLDIVYALVLLAASPVVLFKLLTSRKWRAGLRQRMGDLPQRSGEKRCIWLHAVSVGETNAIRTLTELIERECPDWEIRVSTTTETGQKVARERYGEQRCFYLPLDFRFVLKKAFERIRPDVLVLVELEAWPNLMRMARERGVPVVIVNGRMREEKVARYRELRWLFGPALETDSLNLFCVQNEAYRSRFIRAGFPESKVQVTGTMKYDAVRTEVPADQVEKLRAALGLEPRERVWVAGCTWPGEEAICLRAHRLLQQMAPELRLVIAPRHIERADDIAREISSAGFECRRRSLAFGPTGPGAVPLLDSIGELSYLYSIAEVVFVGKSLTARGGHNVLEPAALGVAPVFGPLTENFQDEAQLLLSAGAAERVRDEAELTQALASLLKDPQRRAEMARKGREAVQQQRGASTRHLEIIKQLIAQRAI